LAGRTDTTAGKGAMDYLLDLWLSVAMHRPDGILVGWDAETIEHYAGWSGEENALFNFLLEVRFIESALSGDYCIHGWAEHQPYVSTAKYRSEKAKKAAYIKHYGVGRGTKMFKRDMQEHESTLPTIQEEQQKEENVDILPVVEDKPSKKGDIKELIRDYEKQSSPMKESQRTFAENNIRHWLKDHTFDELQRSANNYLALNRDNARHFIKRCYNFFAVSGEDAAFFRPYITSNHHADSIEKSKRLREADLCCKSFTPHGDCKTMRGSLDFCNDCDAKTGPILTREQMAELFKLKKLGEAGNDP
jgi:Sec-independent protein translocase protein TatA